MDKMILDNIKQRHAARRAVADALANEESRELTRHFQESLDDGKAMIEGISDLTQRLEREQLEHLQSQRQLRERAQLYQDAMNEVNRLRTKLDDARALLRQIETDTLADNEKEILRDVLRD